MNNTLRFPADTFTMDHKTVKTRAGEVEVTYRKYEHLPYVANPVDVEISVPGHLGSREPERQGLRPRQRSDFLCH